MPELPLTEMLSEAVPNGSMRILWCRLCGAITAIKVTDGTISGDPAQHNQYHAQRGERIDG